MATKTYVEYYDDLNGNVGAKTVEFMLDGVHYEIDLDSSNEAAFREVLGDYIAYGRRIEKVNKGRSQTSARTRGFTQSRAKKVQNAKIREWIASIGYEVPTHGRIPVMHKQAYFEAHPNVAEVPR